MKKTLSIITMLTLVFAMVLTGYVSAAATVSVTAPTEAVAVGDTVVVTITPSEVLEGLEFDLTYDAEVLEYVSCVGPTGDDITKLVNASVAGTVTAAFGNPYEAVDMTVTVTFTAIAESEGAEITVDGLVLQDANGDKTNPEASVNTVVVGEVTEEPPVDDPIEDPIEDPVEDPTEDPVEDPGETGLDDEKPGIPQTGANIFAYVVAGIALVAVLALVVKAKKD